MRLVAILDVSGSMAVYARVFLAFVKGLLGADQSTDAYLFHTRLVRITDALRDPDALRVVNRLSLLARGLAAGQRPGLTWLRSKRIIPPYSPKLGWGGWAHLKAL